MKKMLLLLSFWPVWSFAQNTYSVSNIRGVRSDYYTLQGAIDSVPAGSTLLVFPSPSSYGIITVAKKITIYGSGFMLDQNKTPFTAPNETGVILDAINFKQGSDHSFIQGLQLTDLSASGGYPRLKIDSANYITISRCSFYMQGFGPNLINTKNTFNCTFNGCFFVMRQPTAGFDASGGGLYTEAGTGSQNLYFTNNIIENRGGVGLGLYMNYNIPADYLGNVYFDHNTFVLSIAGSDFCNYTYTNNIFYDTNPQQSSTQASVRMLGTAFNNITSSPSLFANGRGNYINANGDSILAYSTFGYHSFDEKWSVQDSSFAKHFATDGGEVGAFGGKKAFVLSGIPNLPEIYALSVANDTTARGHVLLRIKARASN
jgi:hypothetical protein